MEHPPPRPVFTAKVMMVQATPPTPAPTRHWDSPRGSLMSRLPRRQSNRGGGGGSTDVGKVHGWGGAGGMEAGAQRGYGPYLRKRHRVELWVWKSRSRQIGPCRVDPTAAGPPNRPGRPPSQPLSMKMNPILKVAAKSWQDGNSDLTVSSGPLGSLLYPAARRLRKPQ